MAIISRLVAAFTADTKGFSKGTRRVRKEMGSLTSSIARSVAAIAAPAGITLLVRNTINAVDSLAKVSDKLGIATENLAGLRYAAELTGNSTRNLDLGLQRMTRRVAEAAKGTGEAKMAIKELGLSAKDLVKLTPDEQFREIADAMQKIGNQSDRVRLGFKLFDSEGVGLVNTLRLGRAELERMQFEAERFGYAINRIDAKKIENTKDVFSRLKFALAGVGNVLTEFIAPVLDKIAGFITGHLPSINTFITRLKGGLAELSGRLVALGENAKLVFEFALLQVQRLVSGILRGAKSIESGVKRMINSVFGTNLQPSEGLARMGHVSQGLEAFRRKRIQRLAGRPSQAKNAFLGTRRFLEAGPSAKAIAGLTSPDSLVPGFGGFPSIPAQIGQAAQQSGGDKQLFQLILEELRRIQRNTQLVDG